MRLNSVVYCLNSPANDYNSITSDSTNEASLLYKYGISLKEDSHFDDGWRRNPNICCWSCAPSLFFSFFYFLGIVCCGLLSLPRLVGLMVSVCVIFNASLRCFHIALIHWEIPC